MFRHIQLLTVVTVCHKKVGDVGDVGDIGANCPILKLFQLQLFVFPLYAMKEKSKTSEQGFFISEIIQSNLIVKCPLLTRFSMLHGSFIRWPRRFSFDFSLKVYNAKTRNQRKNLSEAVLEQRFALPFLMLSLPFLVWGIFKLLI